MNQFDTRTRFHSMSVAGQVMSSRSVPPSAMSTGRCLCVQRIWGSVDLQTTADFAAVLDRILGQRSDGIILDLSQVDFLSAAGLSILADFCAGARRARTPVALVGGRPVTRPIEACGLTSHLMLCGSVDEAGAAVQSTPR